MTNYISDKITVKDKSLAILITSFNDEEIPEYVIGLITEAFSDLAPFLKDKLQTLYIRNIKQLCIDGKYSGGHCYNRHEAMIAVPSWSMDKQELKSSLRHELHHMARWQNVGYGNTLGGAILSEGIATYYENLLTGWTPPWSQTKLTKEMVEAAKKEWNSSEYNHPKWFFKSKLGEWVGYSLGFWLASKLYEDSFSLSNSVTVKPLGVIDILDEF